MVKYGYINPDSAEWIDPGHWCFQLSILKAFNNIFLQKADGRWKWSLLRALWSRLQSRENILKSQLSLFPGQNWWWTRKWNYNRNGLLASSEKVVSASSEQILPRYHRTDPSTPQDTLSRLVFDSRTKILIMFYVGIQTRYGQNTSSACGVVQSLL